MKIKDIRQFREVYKRVVRSINDPHRDEHYVGNRQKLEDGSEKFGFFEIYHGDKEGYEDTDGIRGYLEGFLDMARDGQAVYEFLQNAVDAHSTKFFLHWGKDEVDGNIYLLLANNGAPFDANGVRSILNIGVSTKAGDGHTIGKFGIGFKLAHRLVGKENGLDELIYQNYGPILFSWANGELAQFKPGVSDSIQPIEQHYEEDKAAERKTVRCLDYDPWLFKILITNFPCQPENTFIPERIRDYQYQETENAFAKTEVEAMARWIEKYREQFAQDFQQGALFFLRLGAGKESHLEEENLAQGVRFSVTILNRLAKHQLGHNGLQEVILGKNRLNPISLDFESFTILKRSAEYRHIRFGKTDDLEPGQLAQEKKDADIEILFGYTDYKKGKELFRNAPNFYLFFPLSEEKHRFRFILQCNAFHKASSRTYLQKGNNGIGINERIFEAFTQKIDSKLWEYSVATDTQKSTAFLQIYANLLLSNPSTNSERKWVNQPLWEPLLGLLKKFLPVKAVNTSREFTIRRDRQPVFVKDSSFPLEEMLSPSTEKAWFYWDQPEDIELQTEAVAKLGLSRFNIIDLIVETENVAMINAWLRRQEPKVVNEFLKEIDRSFNKERANTQTFKENFAALNVWHFEDYFLSIDILSEEGVIEDYLLLFKQVDPFVEVIRKSGFITSRTSISEYQNLDEFIRLRYQSELSYIRDTGNLVRILSQKFKDAKLEPAEKHLVVQSLAKNLSNDKADRIETIRELVIYCNRSGKAVPLKSILPHNTTFEWLANWTIHPSEVNDNLLAEYFCLGEEEIYKQIIHRYWQEVSASFTSSQRQKCYQFLIDTYEYGYPDFSGLPFVLIDRQFYSHDADFYFHSALAKLNDEDFERLSQAMAKLGVTQIPDKQLLSFYSEEPFDLSEKKLELKSESEQLFPLQEIKVLLLFCQEIKVDIYEQIVVQVAIQDYSKISVRTKHDEEQQVSISNELLIDYIGKYSENAFVVLPKTLQQFATLGAFTEDEVIECEINDLLLNERPEEGRLISLFTALRSTKEDHKKSLLRVLDRIDVLVGGKPENYQLLRAFLKLLFSTELEIEAKAKIVREKLVLSDPANRLQELAFSELGLLGRDEISFDDGLPSLSVSQILNSDPAAETNAIIAKLVKQLTSEKLGKETLEKVFGLEDEQDKAAVIRKLFENSPVLENGMQLAFVLRCVSSESVAEIPSFEVYDLTQQKRPLFQYWYLQTPENRFIPSDSRLHTCYYGLDDTLGLGKQSFIYKYAETELSINLNAKIINQQLHLPGVKSLSESQQGLLLIWLWQNWQREPTAQITHPINTKWRELLGFAPHLTIVSDSDLVYSEEVFPSELRRVFERRTELNIQDKKVKNFLHALGAETDQSLVFLLRNCLLNESTFEGKITSINPYFLANTLTLLAKAEWVGNIDDTEQFQIIAEIYERLIDDEENTWHVPYPILLDSDPGAYTLKYEKAGYSLRNLDKLKELLINTSDLVSAFDRTIVFNYFPLQDDQFEELQFKTVIDEESILAQMQPWTEDFYTLWRESNPDIDIVQVTGAIPRKVLANGRVVKRFEQGYVEHFQGRILISSDLSDNKILELIAENNLLTIAQLQSLKQVAKEFKEEIASLYQKMRENPKRKALLEQLEEETKAEEIRKEQVRQLNELEKYSYGWFQNLIALMMNQEKQPNQSIGTVSFSNLRFEDEGRRLIRLSGASRLVSTKIEICTDFKATIRYRKSLKETAVLKSKIRGVSKKGNDLLVLPVAPLDFLEIREKDVLQVELTFVRSIDLLRRLKTAFSELNFEPSINLRRNLSPNADFIFGPPGTGKTTTIAKKILEEIKSNKTKRTLILTPTNKAADVLTNKILSIAEQQGGSDVDSWLVRYGSSNDLSLIDRQIVYNSTDFQIDLYNTCVVVSTIHRYPYDKVIKKHCQEEHIPELLRDEDWDTIIFDEASMIPLAYIVYVLTHRKFRQHSKQNLTRFIIGGDPFQLPPVVDLGDNPDIIDKDAIERETIYKMIELESFVPARQCKIPVYSDRIINLDTQYRAIQTLGELYSKFQYEGLLSHGRINHQGGSPVPKPLPLFFSKKLGFKPITIIRYPVNTEDSLFEPQKIGGSPYQLFVSFLVKELIEKFKEECGKKKWNLGVVSPYRAQATLIQKLLESQRQKQNVSILTDTVHGFQGDERDLMFVVLNPSSFEVARSRFLREKYILNVAISRARDYLVLLIPDEHSKGINNLPLIHENHPLSLLNLIYEELPKSDVARISSKKIEKILLGSKNYFRDNSFTNAHQIVNIYGNPEMRYMVRIGKDAVDINLEA